MIYAINFKESGEVLTPESFMKYWPKYGSNMLQGWRAPKKIYYTLGQAKTGFSHIPDAIKPFVEISEFTKSKSVVDGADLMIIQKEAKDKKDVKRREAIKKRELEYATKKLEEAKRQYDRLRKG